MRAPLRSLLTLVLLAGAAGRAPAGPAPDAPEALLDDPDPDKRIEGIDALEKLGRDKGRETRVVRLLADPDWAVAIRAAKALAALGAEASRDALVHTAVDGEILWLRDAAVESLRALDAAGAAERLLHRAASVRDPAQKARALRASGRLASGAMLKQLRPFSKSPDPLVEAAGIEAVGRLVADASAREEVLAWLVEAAEERRADRKRFLAYGAAVDALSAVDDPRARAALAAEVALAPDDDDYVPARVARVLSAAGAGAAADAILGAMPKAKSPAAERRMTRLVGRLALPALRGVLTASLSHRDAGVRVEAAKALATLGDATLWAGLEQLLGDESPEVRSEAWAALARLEAPSSFRARAERARADKSEEVRLQFVTALFDRNEPAAIPVLAASFSDPSWRVACAAIAAAGALGTADDRERFEPLLSSRDWHVRAAAYEALGRLRAAKAIPLLAAGLDDKDPVVRGVCHANLQILSSQRLPPDAKEWMRWYDEHGATLRLVKRSRLPPPPGPSAPGAGDRYAPSSYGRKRGVEILQKARILVVTGAWDHVERVLDHLRIPNTTLRAQQIDEVGLNPNQVVLVNCEGNVDSHGAERLRWFATVGGYLISTDWAVTKAVATCFPGYVEQLATTSTGNDVVAVEAAAPGHPFIAGVFEGVPALEWWLEVRAFPLSIVRPARVDVLVDSREMRWKYGTSPMAVTFRWGLGKVTHAVSHFYLQEEALANASTPRERMIFAADALGIPLPDIRRLAAEGRFSARFDESTMREIAPEYSMFRVLVNVVAEKSRWVEGL